MADLGKVALPSEAEIEHPLFFEKSHEVEIRARDLVFSPCSKKHAVALARKWHSRLPNTQSGPWMFAFSGEIAGITYVVALWNNPSARGLPSDWLELRRLACAPNAPFNTPSRFLSFMAGWFRANQPQFKRLISYQDVSVHTGTIYRAAGWRVGSIAKARVRDRTKNRRGADRAYRKNTNGVQVDSSEKVRWEFPLWKRRENNAACPEDAPRPSGVSRVKPPEVAPISSELAARPRQQMETQDLFHTEGTLVGASDETESNC